MNLHYSIIIPCYNHLDLTIQCLKSIERNSNMKSLEIILIDDHSSDGTMVWGIEWTKESNNRTYIHQEARKGFPIACNEGMKRAEGDYIILLNNDTLVTPNWLLHLENSLFEARRRYKNPNFHLVGPVSNNVSELQQVKIDIPIDKVDDFGNKYYSLNKNKIKPILFLSGFCLMFSRKLYNRVGGFDERFSPGGFEDRDFCLRTRLEGFLACISQDTFIYHHGHKTIDEFPELDRGLANRWKYFEKWKDDKAKKLVAMYYVQDTKYLRKSLEAINDAVDEIVMLDASHKANFIAAQFPKIKIYQDTPLKDKKPIPKLIKLAKSRKPDWLLMIGENEIVENFTKEYAQKLMNPIIPDIMGYEFSEFIVWGDEGKELLYHPKRLPRMFMQRNLPGDFPITEDALYPCPLRIVQNTKDTVWMRNRNVTIWPKENSIALVTIMKNEAKNLDSFLEHTYLAFDEIILLDTGSADDSKPIAKKWGAKVYDFKWTNHFGVARNVAINFANTEWILQVDIDEKVENISKIYEMISSGKDAFLFTIIDLHPGGGVAFPESIRLFRNLKEVAYSGIVHETVAESLFRIKGIQVDRATTKIIHYGRLKPDAEKRKKYYRELAMEQMKKDENNPLPYFHLALMERDEKHIEEALDYIKKAATRGWNKPNIRLEFANTHLLAAKVLYDTLKDIDVGHPYYNEIMKKIEILKNLVKG